MKSKTFLYVLLLIITLGLAAYLDSPFSVINLNYSYTADQPVFAKTVTAPPPPDLPVTEEKLEKRVKENGYVVETYQEYEVYKDKNGNVTKKVPTGKMDTLQYWDYSQKSSSPSALLR